MSDTKAKPIPRFANRGGAFLLNPPAPHNPPSSFSGVRGYEDISLGSIPQTTFAPAYSLSVNGPTNGSGFNVDGFLAGDWLLVDNNSEPENFYYTRWNPYFVANSESESFKRRWVLFYGKFGIGAGPYWVPGTTSTFGNNWYLIGLPGDYGYDFAPYRIYKLWGVAPSDDDLEPVPVPPNDIIGEPPYDPENDDFEEYQETEFYNYYRNFRDDGGGETFDPLGRNIFRVVPGFRMLIRDTRIHERADNEFLTLEAFFP